jgi:hypothetical protein
LPNADGQIDETDDPVAVGFEYTIEQIGQDKSGQIQTWQERRLVVRSLALAESQEKGLRQRVASAVKEINTLDERKKGVVFATRFSRYFYLFINTDSATAIINRYLRFLFSIVCASASVRSKLWPASQPKTLPMSNPFTSHVLVCVTPAKFRVRDIFESWDAMLLHFLEVEEASP